MTKILVIEDEAPLREEIMEWLVYEDYEVIGAGDGVEGVNAAVRDTPDLIVCDISMPGLDGYEVLFYVQSDTTIQATPFIFLTAKATKEDIRKGMQMGADDYLTKPFAQQELLEAIRARFAKKALHNAELQQQLESFKQALDAEHEERLLQAKLVGMFSHDFRNQLAVIKSGASLMRDYADRVSEERRQKWADSIVGTSGLLEAMLDDLLITAQMQAGKFVVRWEPLNLNEFIQNIVKEFQDGVGQRHDIRLIGALPEIAYADERLLRQICANLISNAIKYSSAGSEIDVNLDATETHYILSISDHGIGMAETEIDRLFEAFQRGSNVGKVRGTGLGLAVVKNALELLQATIQVDSKEKIGTTFRVFFPMRSNPD